jgi:hypothetical protein
MTRTTILTAAVFTLASAMFVPNAAEAWGKSGYYSYSEGQSASLATKSVSSSSSSSAPASPQSVRD